MLYITHRAQRHLMKKADLNDVAKALENLFPERGFTLFIFDWGPGGTFDYVSNANREDVLSALKEFIAMQEGRLIQGTTTLN